MNTNIIKRFILTNMKFIRYITDILNENFPKLIQLVEVLVKRNFAFYINQKTDRFTQIFTKNIWGSKESFSGPGSVLKQTEIIRREIPKIIDNFNIQSILDIPCGDLNWISRMDLKIMKYLGGDIVPELIANNKRKNQKPNFFFKIIDITRSSLPQSDLILCRDCLVHLSFKDIFSTIRNIQDSRSKYLLTTTFTHRTKNRNIFSGGWRPINLHFPPFNFPKAKLIINEGCSEANGIASDKSLALWFIEDLPDYD